MIDKSNEMDSTSVKHVAKINEIKLYIKTLNSKKHFRRYQIRSEIKNINIYVDKLFEINSWFRVYRILLPDSNAAHYSAVCVRLIRYLERKVKKFAEADEKCSDECASDSYDESFLNTSDFDSVSDSN